MKYGSIVEKLTLEEKASLLSGANFWNTKAIDRLGIPPIMLTDGPHGLRKQGGKADHLGLNASIPSTCFPTAAALANSWDPSLVHRVGAAIGREAAAEEVSVLLGPGLNIIRNPLGGRTFEYYSEDPYLAGKLATDMVKGIQSNGIAASPKHFAVNSQEHMRMSIDEVVDERTLREIYLEGFRYVVKDSDPGTIMTAYNKVNGTYANENTHLMQDILYGEWGFKGVAVTDWGGNNDRVAGLKAGNQLEMPSTNGITDRDVVAAVAVGELDESIVDARVDDLLGLIFKTTETFKEKPHIDYEEHHAQALEAARRSIVLLKNQDEMLPLKKAKSVAVIGDFAQTPRYQGAGSSLVNPTRVDNAYDALLATDIPIVGFAKGFERFGKKSERLVKQAVRLAKTASTVLLFLGLDETAEAEGLDREHMHLRENQLELIAALTAAHENIIVVLSGGSPIEMPFVENIKAIVHASLGGQGGGTAIADVLTGKYNPGGKLAVTYPLRYSDVPSAKYYPGFEATAEHREGLFVGYRYYDTKQVPVLFPFGFGLSYTTFAYSNLTISEESVSFTITNTGLVEGEEIAQVYVKSIDSKIFRANKELKGFAKVSLEPGESKEVTVLLDDHAFAYFNTAVNSWVREPGEYEIQVGCSIDHILASQRMILEGEPAENPYNNEDFTAYFNADVANVSDEAFERLLGRPLPARLWDKEKKLGIEDTFAQLKGTNFIGRFTYGTLINIRRLFFALRKPLIANNVMFIVNLPFVKLVRMSGGKVSQKAVERFLRIVNR